MRFHAPLAALVALGLASFAHGQADAPPVPLPPDGDGAAAALAASPRHGESVDVRGDDDDSPAITTYVAYPERPDKAPVVIVIHEIFGQSDWVRSVADALAAEGFIAVAPDLLSGKGPGGGGTDSFAEGEVRNAIRRLTTDEVEDRLDDVRDYATALPAASGKVGVIGFCWGGSASFNYAAESDDDEGENELGAAVVYYGTAPTDADDLDDIGVPVLGLYGGDDARVTGTVAATTAAMRETGKSFEPIVYDGAGHGFLRQQSGRDGANARAAKAAWSRTVAFLREHLESDRGGAE